MQLSPETIFRYMLNKKIAFSFHEKKIVIMNINSVDVSNNRRQHLPGELEVGWLVGPRSYANRHIIFNMSPSIMSLSTKGCFFSFTRCYVCGTSGTHILLCLFKALDLAKFSPHRFLGPLLS